MNVCFMLGKLTTNGGIGRAVSILANSLANEEDIKVFVLSYYDDGLQNLYYVAPCVKQDYLLTSYASMMKMMLSGGEKILRKYLIEHNIDILVACGALFFPICVRATRNTKIRSICWEHTSPKQDSDYRGQAFARRYGIVNSDINVVLTRRALDIYRNKYNCHNTLQIYNPLDNAALLKAGNYRSDSKRIISVGRLSYPKNYQIAIKIASEILPANPEWTWDIYGQGEEYDKLNRMIQEYGLTQQMKLRGQVSNIYELYNQYAFMVMTSRFEGFPMTLLEGMGNGLPLISFDIETGPNEIIVNGMNGFIVPSGNVSLMKEKIQLLINDSNLRKKMSDDNSHRVSEFSVDFITQKWYSLLKMM